ncbi:unnamed protein product, partial [Brassica oleracea var. botrytis]
GSTFSLSSNGGEDFYTGNNVYGFFVGVAPPERSPSRVTSLTFSSRGKWGSLVS